MNLPGVEIFLEKHQINGPAATQIREWAQDSLYWNAMILLDPADVAVVVMGAPDAREFEKQLRHRIERKLDILP